MSNISSHISMPSSVEYTQSRVIEDADIKCTSMYMQPTGRPCFTHDMLRDISLWQAHIRNRVSSALNSGQDNPIRYAAGFSSVPGFFNLGGDLELFSKCIRENDRSKLTEYATKCIDVVHAYSVGFDVPVTTIAVVQGSALGGGFESVLAAHVIIAERGVQMGFPEVLFNLFPGMGAYSLLSRRISPVLAERMITSGKLYSSEDLYEMGIVSYLAEPGEGEVALRRFIRQAEKRTHVHDLVRHTRAALNRVPYEELLDVVQLWVDCALNLTEKEVATMERLVRAQNKQIPRCAPVQSMTG